MRKCMLCISMICIVFIGSSPTMAIPLQNLFDGGSVTVGDVEFSNWKLINQTKFLSSLPDYSNVNVSPLTDQTLNPGLHFDTDGEFTSSGGFNDLGNFLDIEFKFSVTASGNQLIKDNFLEIPDPEGYSFTGPGVITIEETIEDSLGNQLGSMKVEVDTRNNINNFQASAEFTPQKEIRVVKNILVSNDNPNSSASLDVFNQRFSQVPEPGTVILLGTGLLGLIGFGRKKLFKKS